MTESDIQLKAARLTQALTDANPDKISVDHTSAPPIEILYPNLLDSQGGLTCKGKDIPMDHRTYLEPKIFNDFFMLNRTSIAPRIFQRWALISAIGALVGRSVYMEEEGTKTYPNMYVALVGETGSGKSSAIRMIRPLMDKAGYGAVADAATTKDKFLMDMVDSFQYKTDKGKTKSLDDILDEELFSNEEERRISEGWICCHEWNEYFRTQGNTGNFDFINTILAMYDNPDSMASRSKSTSSVYVNEPTLNILGGTTINNLLQFAPILSAEPFYSRTLLIHSPRTNQIYKPAASQKPLEDKIILGLKNIRDMKGKMIFENEESRDIFDTINQNSGEYKVPDARMNPFYSRRELHLRKLCMIIAVAHGKYKISVNDVMHANAILSFAESFMQRAIGEYGGMRQGIAETVIMQVLNESSEPLSNGALILRTAHVTENINKLGEIIAKLNSMGRIAIDGESKWHSLQRNFRIKSPFAMMEELYEYY